MHGILSIDDFQHEKSIELIENYGLNIDDIAEALDDDIPSDQSDSLNQGLLNSRKYASRAAICYELSKHGSLAFVTVSDIFFRQTSGENTHFTLMIDPLPIYCDSSPLDYEQLGKAFSDLAVLEEDIHLGNLERSLKKRRNGFH